MSFALIGGLALASHKVVRATQDIDLLVDLDHADVFEHKLAGLVTTASTAIPMPATTSAPTSGSIFSTPVVPLPGNCWPARAVWSRLLVTCASFSSEGLIGFKLQALVNDPPPHPGPGRYPGLVAGQPRFTEHD